jgi:pantoate--beta-alanine ligase
LAGLALHFSIVIFYTRIISKRVEKNLLSKRSRTIEIIHRPSHMQACSERMRAQGKSIGFVPTMGFLHPGHLSLMEVAGNRADRVVVSIFVNPAQFAPGEDFEEYPRDMAKDLALSEKAGVDVVFAPAVEDMYPHDHETYVRLELLPQHLCGISRPVFFRGVATIVTKLFHMVRPHVAVFGLKDYQQFRVIRKMVRDLNFGVEIIGAPTIRESDGLAMSSRNAYLQGVQRKSALSLIEALKKAQQQVQAGGKNSADILQAARQCIESYPDTRIDYIRICDPDNLEDIASIEGPVLMALAVTVGKTRLIDNMILKP